MVRREIQKGNRHNRFMAGSSREWTAFSYGGGAFRADKKLINSRNFHELLRSWLSLIWTLTEFIEKMTRYQNLSHPDRNFLIIVPHNGLRLAYMVLERERDKKFTAAHLARAFDLITSKSESKVNHACIAVGPFCS